MYYIKQKYYHADNGHYKLPALPGWEDYVQKSMEIVVERVKPAYLENTDQ